MEILSIQVTFLRSTCMMKTCKELKNLEEKMARAIINYLEEAKNPEKDHPKL